MWLSEKKKKKKRLKQKVVVDVGDHLKLTLTSQAEVCNLLVAVVVWSYCKFWLHLDQVKVACPESAS